GRPPERLHGRHAAIAPGEDVSAYALHPSLFGLALELPFALELQRIALLQDKPVVGLAGTAARVACIDSGGFALGMAEEGSWGLKVLGVLIQVPDRGEVPGLVRRQVHAETAPDHLDELLG